jgi:DNA-directed RNA polymerase subunit N (RpoN/RPB10)
MLYFKCPTCKTLLANKQIPFEQKLEKICSQHGKSDNAIEKEKQELLDDLEIKNICCRMRILTYIRIVDIVI